MFGDLKQVVVVEIKEELFALNADDVECIVRVPLLSKVPKTPNYFLGISNYRGEVLPVIDLQLKLEYEKVKINDDNSRAVIVDTEYGKIAFVVGKVDSILNTESMNMDSVPEAILEGKEKKFIKGVFKRSSDGRLIQLLDIKELIDDEKILESKKVERRTSKESYQDKKENIEEEKFITFNVGDVEYGISIFQVNEILRYQETTEVPGLPNFVKGIFSLRDEVIPVISASNYFGKGENIDKETNRIVIINIQGVKLGLLVDFVNEVLAVDKRLVDPVDGLFLENDKKEVEKIIKLNDGERIVLVINPVKMFDEEELSKIAAHLKESQSQGDEQMEENLMENIDEIIQVVTFKVEDEHYGFPIEIVQEINRYINVTRVPKSPAFVEGIINLRGEVIPLVDIRKRFDLPEKEKDEFTRLIIVNINDIKVGFVVDEVEEVLRVPKDRLDEVPPVLASAVNSEFISNIIKLEDKMIMILEAEKMFSEEEYKKLEKVKK